MPNDRYPNGDVLSVIDYFYAAATDVEKWDECLSRLLCLFDASCCQIGYWDIEHRRLGFNVHKGMDHITPAMWQKFQSLLPEDPRFQVWERLPERPHSCRATLPVERLHASRVYREIMAPSQIEYTLGAKLLAGDDGSSAGLAVMRPPNKSPFNHQDTKLMAALIPHLKRSFEIHKRLALLDFQNRASLEALDKILSGIIILDEYGHVKFVNEPARIIASERDGLAILDDQLQLANRKLFSEILTSACAAIQGARHGEVHFSKAFSVSRPSGKHPYSALLCSLWGNHLQFGLGGLDDPLAVLFISDPEDPIETPSNLLQRLFELTPAEARLAAQFARTTSIKKSAEILGISEGTARVYMKRIFSKTGTKSQAALIKLVLSGPGVIRTSCHSDTAL